MPRHCGTELLVGPWHRLYMGTESQQGIESQQLSKAMPHCLQGCGIASNQQLGQTWHTHGVMGAFRP